MGHHHLDLGNQLADAFCQAADILDARTDIEDLPAAVVFAHDRFAHDDRIVGQDEGAHRQAIHRRCGNQAHLPHTREGQLQRARNWGGGQRQDVNVARDILQLLLLRHAEMLLLVDDDHAEPAEGDALAQQGVGTDDDIDLPRG